MNNKSTSKKNKMFEVIFTRVHSGSIRIKAPSKTKALEMYQGKVERGLGTKFEVTYVDPDVLLVEKSKRPQVV